MFFELFIISAAALVQQDTLNVGPSTSQIQVVIPEHSYRKIMKAEKSGLIDTTRVLSTKIFDGQTEIFVSFDDGPSGDPSFTFESGPRGAFIGRIFATKIEIEPEGTIISTGHTNNLFNQTHKYKIKNNKLEEVAQPFFHVGIRSTALLTTEARASVQPSAEIVFKIIKGELYEIVLSDPGSRFFLIKNRQGVVGWVKIETTQTATLFKEIFYNGD